MRISDWSSDVCSSDLQVHRDLDRLVELRARLRLHQLDGLGHRIDAVTVDAGVRARQSLALGRHRRHSTTSMPMDRAEPLTMATAPSTSTAFRSTIFASAISLTWAMVTLPTVLRLGVAVPLATPEAFLRKYATGGVLVTKVKVR